MERVNVGVIERGEDGNAGGSRWFKRSDAKGGELGLSPTGKVRLALMIGWIEVCTTEVRIFKHAV